MAAMGSFQGFPPELFTFFEGLEKDNSKAYWEANKTVWTANIQRPMEQLLADLEDEFPPLRMFRPNRDVRFSKDKSPYKLWVGATTESRAVGGTGYYLRVEASGLRTGCGAMVMARDQLERFRAAIDHDVHGARFGELTGQLAAKSLPVSSGAEPPLKTTPSGYPKDHPRGEFLRWKGAVIVKGYDTAEWMHTPEAIDRIREVWHGAEPLKEWIDEHVRASEEPPSRRGGPRQRGPAGAAVRS